jgi:hypothetical protein
MTMDLDFSLFLGLALGALAFFAHMRLPLRVFLIFELFDLAF